MAFEEIFGTGFAAGFVHPVARFALFAALEKHIAEAEGFADQGIEIDAFKDDVAAERGGGQRRIVRVFADGIDDGLIEEGDLAFIVGFEIEEAILADAASGDELDGLALFDLMRARRLPVMAEVVVAGRKVEVADQGHVEDPDRLSGKHFRWHRIHDVDSCVLLLNEPALALCIDVQEVRR